jgi:GTPase SAR1 family protein
MNSLGGGVNPQTLDGGDDYHFKFKIALVGDSVVGKSAFLDAIS